MAKKTKAKASRKAAKRTSRSSLAGKAGQAGQSKTPPQTSTPPPPPRAGDTSELHPAVPMVVSLLAPGLGLLLLKNRDRVKDAFLIFGIWFSYFAASFVLTFFIVGVCCWLPLPLLNVAAGIHSFDEAALEQGGKPILFQKGFRIFKD